MSWAATAVVGGSVVSGYFQSQAADKAAGAQVQTAQLGIDEQRRQFEAVQALLQPYVEGGAEALGGQQALLGLAGPGAQASAIKMLENSPQFQALVDQGETGILQNAAATGGLRGGNVQGALAQFRPQILSQLIESQFSKLGSIAGMGQASAAGVGAAGQQTGANIANLFGQIGQARAGSAVAKGQALAGVANTGQTLATLKLLGAF